MKFLPLLLANLFRKKIRTALTVGYESHLTFLGSGFGDVVPQAPWLRLVVPAQSLIGFGLLTAAVSWNERAQDLGSRPIDGCCRSTVC